MRRGDELVAGRGEGGTELRSGAMVFRFRRVAIPRSQVLLLSYDTSSEEWDR